jgi:hypothetical protein
MTERLLRALLLLLLVAGCSPEDRSCTELACSAGVGLELTTPDGAWPTGAYRLTVTSIQRTITCTLTLDEPLEPTASQSFACDSAVFVNLVNESRCLEPTNSLSCSQVEGRHRLVGSIDTLEDRLTVELRRDDQPLLSTEVTPAYTEREINGPGCGVCRHATVALVAGA